MTDREHALPPDSQQPTWPLADASQRHPAGSGETGPTQPITGQPAPGQPAPGHPSPATPSAPSGATPSAAHPAAPGAPSGATPSAPSGATPSAPSGATPSAAHPAAPGAYAHPAAPGAYAHHGAPPPPAAPTGPTAPTTPSQGFAGPYPPGHGPYAQPTPAFHGSGQPYGYRQHPTYAPPASAYRPNQYTGPLGLPTRPHPAAPRGRAAKRIGVAAAVLGLMLGSGVLGGVAATQFDNDGPVVSANRTPTVAAVQTGSLADVVSAVSPSVVSISVSVRGGSGTGSGVIVDPNGTILTNAHVVASASRIQVLLSDGRRLDAQLVGADTSADVALIRVDGAGPLAPANLATSGSVRVGDTVLAFGSPLGLDGSVTAGIVSSVDRAVEGRSSNLSGMIQTDAAINPGNSGGPLVNIAGQVVGMNTAIATTGDGGGNIGVGFAIPIATAMQVADTLGAR